MSRAFNKISATPHCNPGQGQGISRNLRRLTSWWGMGLLFLTSLSFAEPSLPDVLTHLEAKEKSIKSIKFQFEQQTLFLTTGQSVHLKADAYFGAHGRLRIQKKVPDQQVTISDGKTVWVYNPGPNQVWQGPAKSWLKAGWMPKGLVPLNGYVTELKNNFNLKVVSSSDTDHVTLDAVPQDSRQAYKLQLTFSTKTWLPTKTLYVSDSARVTTTLDAIEINPSDIAHQFQFTIPKGATVIPLN